MSTAKKALTGVNLGGWFIPEKWLTPSIFEGLEADDLYELTRTNKGRQRYAHHVESFVTEDDIRWLRDAGVQMVRVPVGYWLFDGTDGYPPSIDRLDWLMKIAERYKLSVLIDLHAARGSQNGKMHSGRKGIPGWQKSRQYQDETIELLVKIAIRYRDNSAFWGIELLNEPQLGRSFFTLLYFYRRAYKRLRKVLRPGVYTVFHDSFWPLLFSGALVARKQYPVALDTHLYALEPRVFGRFSMRTYLRLQKILYGSLLAVLRLRQSVIVGEWSSVLPPQLFVRTSQADHKGYLAANVAAQQQLYSHCLAHMYWNYKADGEGMWNFRSLVERGDLVIQ